MKVGINKDGILKIEAETPLECYALCVWNDNNPIPEELKNLIISREIPVLCK